MVWTRSSAAESVLLAMADYRAEVGRRIRELRLARGLTQDELADKVGVREKTVSRWEGGKHSGYIRNVKALAEALGVEPEEITGTPPAPLGLGVSDSHLDREQLDRIEEKLDRQYVILGDILNAFATPEAQRAAGLERISRAGRELAELGRQRATARSGNSTAQRESRDRPATG